MIGISADNPQAQAKFREKFDLTMPLLSDTDKKVAQAYGVYKEKNMYGKKVMGLERTTFMEASSLSRKPCGMLSCTSIWI